MARKKTSARKNLIIFILALICALETTVIFKAYLFPPKKKVAPPARPVKIVKPVKYYKAAIVLDDFGYGTKNLETLFSIKRPITVAILPQVPYSEYVAKKARQNGMQVILHLPLEPHQDSADNVGLEKGTITCDMTSEKAVSRLEQCLASVPGASGVSNHMGSKATEDRTLMRVLLIEIKRRRLYFLDSMVTTASVCGEVSKSINLKYAERDVFLDNENNPAYIRGQLLELADTAIASGKAVGIGHDRPATIRVVKETIPELEKKGIKFVFVSDLVK